MKPTTIASLQKCKQDKKRFATITAYDYSFAKLFADEGINVMLVGDSLGMTVQGHDSTLPVTVADIAYHTAAVRRGAPNCLLLADLPFMAYATPEQAFENAATVMRAGANMVKIEGGEWLVETVQMLTERAVPVCGHLGLTPQSVNIFGGYKVQGRGDEAGDRLLSDALALEAAGAQLLVLECVPVELAKRITEALAIPVIGIGAGNVTDGQILVMHDAFGITGGHIPKFAKNFLAETGDIRAAVRQYMAEVESGVYPGEEHSFPLRSDVVLIIETLPLLRQQIRRLRMEGKRVALVPTMGNLHDGHMKLVDEAKARADVVVVSIFVNPMQFDRPEDLARYPRTLQEDCEKLNKRKVDLVFAPSVKEIYPNGTETHTYVDVPGLSTMLEGASRPGHFRGVSTIVSKLFNLVQPDIACFGEKDFQQLALIRKMVADMGFDIEIVGVPIMRAKDGLALSSRNGYLTAEQRKIAPGLYKVLSSIADKLQAGERDLDEIIAIAGQELNEKGFRSDDIQIRDADTLLEISENSKRAVILVAAWLGDARLIDNKLVELA